MHCMYVFLVILASDFVCNCKVFIHQECYGTGSKIFEGIGL